MTKLFKNYKKMEGRNKPEMGLYCTRIFFVFFSLLGLYLIFKIGGNQTEWMADIWCCLHQLIRPDFKNYGSQNRFNQPFLYSSLTRGPSNHVTFYYFLV